MPSAQPLTAEEVAGVETAAMTAAAAEAAAVHGQAEEETLRRQVTWLRAELEAERSARQELLAQVSALQWEASSSLGALRVGGFAAAAPRAPCAVAGQLSPPPGLSRRTPSAAAEVCDVRLVSKCSRRAEDSELIAGDAWCRVHCPCCGLELRLELLPCNALAVIAKSAWVGWERLLCGARLRLTSRRAEGKVFGAEVVDGFCATFCPACRRPVTVALGPSARTVAPPPVPRRRGNGTLRQGRLAARRRWCVSVETRRRRRELKTLS
mmetsp:Transcript_28402/g.78074  ORF Transcript_28402/g.78074 Transcript_28402/m.78074 type:complete len:267 (-) Transcript_28402:65-865(-)